MISSGKPITFFQKGDIITRVVPGILGTEEKEVNFVIVKKDILDGSYRGEPMEFVGIANNMIYTKALTGLFKDKILDFRMEHFSEGWDIYIDPKEL